MRTADLFATIATYGSVKRFREHPLPLDTIAELLFAGSRAQTTGEQQLMKFIVLKEDEVKALYDPCYEEDAVMSAPLAIVIVAESDLAEKHFGLRGRRLYVIQDCAAAAQNMLLTASALGLGSCWIHAFDEEEISSLCGLPQTVRPQAVLLFGQPAEEPHRPPLKDFRYLVYWRSYNAKYKDPHLITKDFSVEWARMATQFSHAVRRGIRELRGEADGEAPPREALKEQLRKTKKKVDAFLRSLKK